MSELLEAALAQSERIVVDALADARRELAELDERRAQLTALIGRAEALQRSGSATTQSKVLKLHEAITVVLEEAGEQPMTVREIAEIINARSLYRKKDGSPVEVNQIHARTKNYSHLFEKTGPIIRLREVVSGEKK